MNDPVELQHDAWRISELTNDAGLVCGVLSKRAPMPSEGRTWRAWLTLHFKPARGFLPSVEDMRKLAEFEGRLLEELELGGFGVLVAVVLVDGKRDHLFYTADRESFAARLAPLAREITDYRPSIEFAPDPDWMEFREMVG